MFNVYFSFIEKTSIYWYECFELEWYDKNKIDESCLEFSAWIYEGLFPFWYNLRRYDEREQEQKYDWFTLTRSPYVTAKKACSYVTIPWSYKLLSNKNDINLELVLQYSDKQWCWDLLSAHKNITLQHVLLYPELPWTYKGLSKNRNVSIEYVQQNMCKPWDWELLSQNESMTLEIVEKYKNDFPWHYPSLSKNTNINIHFVCENIEEKWDWMSLSCNAAFRFDDIIKHKQLPWQWYVVTSNPNITVDHIEQFPMFSWNDETVLLKKTIRQRECFLRKCHSEFFMKEIAEELMSVVYSPENYEYVKNYLY